MSPDPTRPASTDASTDARIDSPTAASIDPLTGVATDLPASPASATDPSSRPDPEHFHAALGHVEHQWNSGGMAAGAARGLVYSIVETLGTLVGDPDLPEHVRSGYQGLLESAHELRAKIRE